MREVWGGVATRGFAADSFRGLWFEEAYVPPMGQTMVNDLELPLSNGRSKAHEGCKNLHSVPRRWRYNLDALRGQWQAGVEPVQVGIDAVIAPEILLRKEPGIEWVGFGDVLVVEDEG